MKYENSRVNIITFSWQKEKRCNKYTQNTWTQFMPNLEPMAKYNKYLIDNKYNS